MVTGYTAKLVDSGQPFEAFVMSCARAFTVHDEEIPEKWKVDPYHREEVRKAKNGIRRVKGLSPKACEKEARLWLRQTIKRQNDSKKKVAAAKERLVAMKARVESWAPPTDDHQDLKKFMLQQLGETIDRDGSFEPERLPEVYSGEEWRRDTLESLERDLEYHTRELEAEIDRVAKLNRWMQALRKSLMGTWKK